MVVDDKDVDFSIMIIHDMAAFFELVVIVWSGKTIAIEDDEKEEAILVEDK